MPQTTISSFFKATKASIKDTKTYSHVKNKSNEVASQIEEILSPTPSESARRGRLDEKCPLREAS